jgi:hypothetical protein
MSATDEIYRELWDGLEKGLAWPEFLARHSTSKGPLYNAIGRFFAEAGTKIAVLKEEMSQRQGGLDQAQTTLDSLDQQKKEAQDNVISLEERRNVMAEQVKATETKLAGKSELLKQVADLEKMGFNTDTLKQLREALTEIGAKHGLKGKEAASKFFADLKDYDAKTGFEQEIHRLETITSTKKLEAEKWRAEADKSSRHYQDLSEAIAAVQSLIKQGAKTEQIVSWNGIVSKVGGPAKLQGELGQYKSMSELLNARRSDIEDCDKKLKELGAQVKALNEQKMAIEGAIKSLSASGVKQINDVFDKAVTGLNSLSASGVQKINDASNKALTALNSLSAAGANKINEVSDEAMAGLNSLYDSGGETINALSQQAVTGLQSLLNEIRAENKKLGDLKGEAGKLEKELALARYLTTGDPAVLKAFPREVIISFLDRAWSYCKLNQLNPMVKVPDGFPSKYSSVYSSTQVKLLDLIAWAETGFVGEIQ